MVRLRRCAEVGVPTNLHMKRENNSQQVLKLLINETPDFLNFFFISFFY